MLGLIITKGSPVPCKDFDDIPSADVCDDISAMEDDVVAVLCDVCCVLWLVSFLLFFFFPFFAPKFVEAHSLKKLPRTRKLMVSTTLTKAAKLALNSAVMHENKEIDGTLIALN